MLESLLDKVVGLKACNVIKQIFHNTGCFPVNIVKFFRTPILKKICERLLLKWYSTYDIIKAI